MNAKLLLVSAAAALVALAPAVVYGAPPAPAAAPAPAPVIAQGPVIPGVCVLSVNQAIGESAVGRFASQRMEQIVAQVKAELSPEETAITTEDTALQQARTTLDAGTFQTRVNALQARVQAYRQKADLRQREVQATERKSLNRIAQELDPIARQLYQTHRCSLLLDKNSVMMANPTMDLTAEAVTALNAHIQQFAFDREHLDTAPVTTGR